MKRNKTTIAAFGLLISSLLLLGSARAQDQNHGRVVGDTGVISIGPNQILRISGDGVDQDDVVTFRFRRLGYQASMEATGITKYSVLSSMITNPVVVTGAEGVSYSVHGNQTGVDATRIIVISNRPNVRVNASLIDAATGTVQVLIALLVP